MIKIIPVSELKENQVNTDKVFYIENGEGKNTMAEKYNWAIENIILKQDDNNICFCHEDIEFRTPLDVCDFKLTKLFEDENVGMAGVIGSIELEQSCTWWNPNRHINGVGNIIQGGFRDKVDENKKVILDENGNPEKEKIEYAMSDMPGVHKFLAVVDGCCMFFPKRVFESGLRFDTNLQGYHFYDVDISCQILEKHLQVSTIDILVKHESMGIPPSNFEDMKKVFFQKWSNKIDKWPISRLTKFH